MYYKMYYEMREQPVAIRKTFDSELENMDKVSKIVESCNIIYLIGCGSSISTCYSVRDALRAVSNLPITVFTVMNLPTTRNFSGMKIQ